MSYSNGGGGTLTLPSPTHAHHVDVGAAVVRSLRRSLSRSPSKFALVRSTSQSSGSSPHSPSPRSPAQQALAQVHVSSAAPPRPPATSTTPPLHRPTITTPLRSSVKLSVRSARPKAAASAKPATTTTRTRASPRSPLKRALSVASDSGNSAPSASGGAGAAAGGQENNFNNNGTNLSSSIIALARALSPSSRKSLEKPSSRHSVHLDLSGSSSKNTGSRFLDVRHDAVATVSPLKRSEGNMNLDCSSFGSPVAKRRSLHGTSAGVVVGHDSFNIFDHSPATAQPKSDGLHDDSDQEYRLASSSAALASRDPLLPPPPPPTPQANMPRRTSSLRKSTLQQRYGDKSSFGRRGGEKHLAQLGNEPSSSPNVRARLSLDHYLPPPPPPSRESPFWQGALPNPSLHPFDTSTQRHPLSRSFTTSSSSSSSLPDESPTHFPVQCVDRPRVQPSFARSLPVGALRPTAAAGTPADQQQPLATPNYKHAKPFQAAFMSTGLVSKMNRNPEMEQPQKHGGGGGGGAAQSVMPDTPCKKQVYPSATYPPNSATTRGKQRPSFGTPRTPFGGSASLSSSLSLSSSSSRRNNTFGNPDRAVAPFMPFRTSHTRKGSVLSVEGDSMDGQTGDGDLLPPTPTKPLLFKGLGSGGYNRQQQQSDTPFNTRPLPAPPISAIGFGSAARRQSSSAELSCESSPFRRHTGAHGTGLLRRRRGGGGDKLADGVNNDPALASSPLDQVEFLENKSNSPKTPQDGGMMPPDPSRLSISNAAQEPTLLPPPPSFSTTGERRSLIFPPATPTAAREAPFARMDRRLSITPVNGQRPDDLDDSLMARFDKAEPVGSGEFSRVFRVTKSDRPTSFSAAFLTTPSRRSPPTPSSADQIYAVKKIKLPYLGSKDRESKLREVSILGKFTGCDHIVQLVDSWEQNSHLYIQTEFCEEGSLDKFLENVGSKGRLDDFRIWKVLQELCQGLKHIHDAGFVHLDLKPANVFINYEGVLKIGDFGMATSLPIIDRSIEGEGDREYIGPEILRGEYAQPADVFSLGLMVLEMACNVFLPDNGPTWVALRDNDMSVVSSLTWSDASSIVRDATGMPVESESSLMSHDDDDDDEAIAGLDGILPNDLEGQRGFPFQFGGGGGEKLEETYNPSNLFGMSKRSELRQPPAFMEQATHPSSLDSVVRWMISKDPTQRPTVQQILDTEAISWVSDRRHAGATVFEGNWGPDDAIMMDTEMTDV